MTMKPNFLLYKVEDPIDKDLQCCKWLLTVYKINKVIKSVAKLDTAIKLIALFKFTFFVKDWIINYKNDNNHIIFLNNVHKQLYFKIPNIKLQLWVFCQIQSSTSTVSIVLRVKCLI